VRFQCNHSKSASYAQVKKTEHSCIFLSGTAFNALVMFRPRYINLIHNT